MLREYCDRCGKEIPVIDRDKITFDISYEERFHYSARFTLCKDCLEETGVKEAIYKSRGGQKTEKPKDAVDRLADIIRELLDNQ